MTSVQCASCKHYRDDLKCAAYPKGIPVAIMTSRESHKVPRDGDHGIQWEPASQEWADE